MPRDVDGGFAWEKGTAEDAAIIAGNRLEDIGFRVVADNGSGIGKGDFDRARCHVLVHQEPDAAVSVDPLHHADGAGAVTRDA